MCTVLRGGTLWHRVVQRGAVEGCRPHPADKIRPLRLTDLPRTDDKDDLRSSHKPRIAYKHGAGALPATVHTHEPRHQHTSRPRLLVDYRVGLILSRTRTKIPSGKPPRVDDLNDARMPCARPHHQHDQIPRTCLLSPRPAPSLLDCSGLNTIPGIAAEVSHWRDD